MPASSNIYAQLKADRPHPHDYLHISTPSHYRHTDKHLRLVMKVVGQRFNRESANKWIDTQIGAIKCITSLVLQSITSDLLAIVRA